MNFGQQLTKLIAESGKTRQQIADELGFKSKSNVTYYEKKDNLPSSEVLIMFCNYFGVSSDYFGDSVLSFSQPAVEYNTDMVKIPVLSDESKNAQEVSYMVIPHSGITDGFAVVIDDDRLLQMGIPKGCTVILSKEPLFKDKHKVLAKINGNSFFATFEKVREGYGIILPANKEASPIIMDEKSPDSPEIVAIVKSVIINED